MWQMTVDKGAEYCKRKVLKIKDNLEAVNQVHHTVDVFIVFRRSAILDVHAMVMQAALLGAVTA